MKRVYSLVAIASLALMMGGCTGSLMPTHTKEFQAVQNDGPRSNITKFSDSLKNLGRLAETYKDSAFTLTALPVENKTAARGKLPSDITVMVESALTSIGSKLIVAKPYDYMDPSTAVGEYFLIKGAITEYDVVTKSARSMQSAFSLTKLANIGRGNDKSGDIDGGIDSEFQEARIAIDFNIVDAKTGNFIAGVQSKNSMKIGSLTDSHDFGFSIAGSGIGISGSVTKQQGIHQAIRLLVELSIVELIGKLRTYPYWIAIHNGQIDNDLLKKMESDFNQHDKETRKIYIQHLLSIIYPDVSIGQKGMQNTNKRIKEFKKSTGIIPYTNEINTELYTKLLTEIPKVLAQKGWSKDIKRVFNKVLNF